MELSLKSHWVQPQIMRYKRIQTQKNIVKVLTEKYHLPPAFFYRSMFDCEPWSPELYHKILVKVFDCLHATTSEYTFRYRYMAVELANMSPADYIYDLHSFLFLSSKYLGFESTFDHFAPINQAHINWEQEFLVVQES